MKKIVSVVNEPIATLVDLESALLTRIPESFRSDFFTPPHPRDLTLKSIGLDEDMVEAAVDRIRKAIAEGEDILIFGDYDCDGVTATAILWETLHHLGAKALPFLPHREKHGYGLSVAALEEIWQKQKPTLLITVDNGIVAFDAFSWLREKHVDTILTDHHVPGDHFPDSDYRIHTTSLCGAGVAWILARELDSEFAETLLDYAVLGTLADQVPLVGANRSMAWHGLRALRQSSRKSLQALANVAGKNLADADENTVQFVLAPRINAMGRLGDAMEALRALVAKQPARVEALAQGLQTRNTERQSYTESAWKELLATKSEWENDPLTIVVGEWPEGILGLLASQLVDHTSKPAIVLAKNTDFLKASVRSVAGIDIIALLREAGKSVPFLALGGHPLAAGFSLATEHLPALKEVLFSHPTTNHGDDPILEVVGEISPTLFHSDSLSLLHRFAPFGMANSEPTFLVKDVRIENVHPVGKNGNHAQILFTPPGSESTFRAIAFQTSKRFDGDPSTATHLVLKLMPGRRAGEVDLQLVWGQ